MVRRFFRDSAIYIVPTILSTGMSFVMFPFYAHHFSPRQYGVFDLLTLTAMLVGWTVALEIYQGVGVYVSGEKDPRRVRGYASTALWFVCYSAQESERRSSASRSRGCAYRGC
jgi:O-antigen/teichoic acid export membrane protein